jgi:replicative DNA helicase
MPSDIRESGAIEQDADLLIMLYRKESEENAAEQSRPIFAYIAKNKDGETGEVQFNFTGSIQRFADMEEFNNTQPTYDNPAAGITPNRNAMDGYQPERTGTVNWDENF